MGGPTKGAEAIGWIMRWIVAPVIIVIIGGLLFFLGYGIYNFFT